MSSAKWHLGLNVLRNITIPTSSLKAIIPSRLVINTSKYKASRASVLMLLTMQYELEQLESLHSEDTPRCLMITHTIESYWIPSQKKTKSKLHI